MNVKAVASPSLSDFGDKRYVIVDTDTGEIVDDAQGYGYKTLKKAYASWAYKNRDKSKDKERRAKDAAIRQWLKEHTEVLNLLDGYAVSIAKGAMAPDDKVDAALVRSILKDCNIETEYKPRDILKVWMRS